jgi:hypothetical protein
VHVCKPYYVGGILRKIVVQGQFWAKGGDPI